MPWRTKKVAITGGLGFIGSQLAIELVAAGAEVTLIDCSVPEHGANHWNIHPIKDKITLIEADICDRAATDKWVKDQDVIFAISGQVSHGDSMSHPLGDLAYNQTAQITLLESIRETNPTVRIVHTSTRQIYGRPQYLPVNESHPIRPVDINGIHKYAGESYYRLYQEVYNIPSTILRLTNTYGPGQLIRHNRQGFMGVFLRLALTGEPIKLFGDGTQLRDFNYASDVSSALMIAAETPACEGQIYNLGADTHHSLLDVVKILKTITGCNYETIPFPEEKKKIDIGDYYTDYTAFKTATGWTPKTNLESGLKQTINYYKEHLEHYL